MGWRGFFLDKQGRTVLYQAPNLPLILAFTFWLINRIATDITILSIVSSILFNVLLAYWAYLELRFGVNNWRRALGCGVLVWTVVNLVFR